MSSGPQPALSHIDAGTLQEMLGDGNEIALLDIREISAFSAGHLWLATPLPLSRLELSIARLVPNRATRIVVCDTSNELTAKGAARLNTLGYRNLHILDQGIQGWRAAGLSLVTGNYVVAHCFGYAVEEQCALPVMTARQLLRRRKNGEQILLFDARAEEDYLKNSIPGSVSVPAAEIARLVPDLVSSEQTVVVAHCAGVTRGVLGAQGLLNCGLRNPVYTLENGTRGWEMEKQSLRAGQKITPPALCLEVKQFAAQAAAVLAKRFHLNYQSLDQLASWRTANPQRTAYLIDVRSREEYERGHYPGSYWIPGGELAGMTVDHLGTWHGRLFLFADPDCGRAEITASWMLQTGWRDVVIINNWQRSEGLHRGPENNGFELSDGLDIPLIDCSRLTALMDQSSVQLLDFSPSDSYRQQHIPGASWISRASLDIDSIEKQKPDCIVCTSVQGRVAGLAARELQERISIPVFALTGGNLAWAAGDFPVESGMTRIIGEIDDIDHNLAVPPAANPQSIMEWHRRCNAWRRQLYGQFKSDQPLQFAIRC